MFVPLSPIQIMLAEIDVFQRIKGRCSLKLIDRSVFDIDVELVPAKNRYGAEILETKDHFTVCAGIDNDAVAVKRQNRVFSEQLFVLIENFMNQNNIRC